MIMFYFQLFMDFFQGGPRLANPFPNLWAQQAPNVSRPLAPMSADSLFSIVAPAPAPVAASRAVDAHGDSGFDRMLGEAMEADTEEARPAGRAEAPPIRTGTTAPRSAAEAIVAPESMVTDDTGTEEDTGIEELTDVAGPAVETGAEEDVPLPVVADAKTTDDAQVLPAVAADKGADIPQVLPGTSPVVVAPQVETPPERPLTEGGSKATTAPQVLPDQVADDVAPEPVVAARKTEGPQVLPGVAGKTGEPQILPGVVPGPVTNKSTDRQILPGTETAPRTDTAAEPSTPAVTAAGAKAAAAAMAALAPAVAPPPVRPLTDRTGTVSNSARATGDRPSGSGTGPAAAVTGAATGVTAAAALAASTTPTTPETSALSDRPLTPGTGAPAIPVAAAPDAAVKSPVDQPPVEVPPAPVTQASTASQTYSLSNLSTAAVEATAQMAAQIIRRMDARSTRFEMALTPDDLGRVDVSLDIDEHGRLAARLAFDNPAAALDMKGRVDDLRRQLEEAGFHLADDAFQFTQREQTSGEQFDRRQGRAFAAASRLSDETDAAAAVTPPRWMSLSLTPDRVDMKV